MSMPIGRSTDYFLASHAPAGGCFFAQSAAQSRYVITLWGASAQIRSRIIRQTALALCDRGYDVERVHGMENPHDLEAALVPALALFIVNGQKLPPIDEAKEKVWREIDLTSLILPEQYPVFEAKLRDLREQMAVNLELVGECLTTARHQLARLDNGERLNDSQHRRLLEQLAERLFWPNDGQIANRYGEALTGDGPLDYYPNLLVGIQRKYFLNGLSWQSGSQLLLDLAQEAAKAGLNVQCYHSALDGELVKAIVIPARKLAIATNPLTEDFLPLLTEEPAAKQSSRPPASTAADPFGQVTALLAQVKALSATMSEIYQDMIDFPAVEHLEARLLADIIALGQ